MENQKNPLFAIIFVVLLGIAGILGYMIYQEQQATNPVVGQQEDVKEVGGVFDIPGPNATEEEKQAHFQLVQSMVQIGDAIDITGCNALPNVLEVKGGNSVSVKNQDDIEHVIALNPDDIYTVPANSTTDIEFDFSQGFGLYAYGCDEINRPVGMFIVSPQEVQ